MTAFATAQDLSTYLTGATLDDTDDAEFIAQADLLLGLISDDIRTMARNPIIEPEQDETIELAGTWSRDLTIPGRPVQKVDSAKVNGISVDFTFNGRDTLRIGAGTLPTVFDAYDEGPRGRVGQGAQGSSDYDLSSGHWGGPTSTVELVLKRGREKSDVPGVVKSLCLRVAGRVIGNPTGLTQETLGPYSASYGNVLTAGGTHLTRHEVKMLRTRFSRTAGTAKAKGLG